MEKYKISIIVPVYNVEAYLDECIESIINQTFKDFEVIFVDDGSLDASSKIIERYCKKNDNFILLSQKNSGSAGGPRNTGIDIAKGKYIFFLDPDDKLPYTALEYLYTAISNLNVEIVCGSYNDFNSRALWSIKHVVENVFYEERITSFNESVELACNLVPWNKLYDRKFLIRNKIYFNTNLRYGEDRSFVLKSYVLAKKIKIITECVYYYRMRESTTNVSAVQDYSINTFKESIDACKQDKDILEKSIYKCSDIYTKERVQHDFIRFIDYYAKNKLSDEEWNIVIDISKEYIDLFRNDFSKISYTQKRKINYIEEKNVQGLIKYINLKKNIFKIMKNKNSFFIRDYNVLKKGRDFYDLKLSLSDIYPFYKIEKINIDKNNIFIKGWAYIHRLQMREEDSLKKYLVFKNSNNKEICIELESTKRIDICFKKGKGIYNYLYSGFSGNINLDNILKLIDKECSILKLYLKLSLSDNIYKEMYIQDLELHDNISKGQRKYSNLFQRVDMIKFYDTHIFLSGWAFINNYSYYDESVKKRLILKNIINNEELIYELNNDINNWCNSSFEINPYKNNYAYPQWYIDIPYYLLKEGGYKVYIEVINDEICIRDSLKYPSINLTKQRKKLDYGYIAFNRRYRCEFTTNEYIREKCEILFFVQDLSNENYIHNDGYIPLIGKKGDYYNVANDKEDLILKKIAVTHNQLEFWGTYLNNGCDIQQKLILENELGYRYEYLAEDYYFNYFGKNNNGWLNSLSYKINNGRYKIKIIIESNGKEKIFDKFRLSDGLNKNYVVWNTAHYVGKTKINFIKNQDLLDCGLFEVQIDISQSKRNLINGIKIKSIKKIKKIICKVLNNIKVHNIFKKSKVQIRTKIYLLLYRLSSKLPINMNRITMVSYKEKMPSDYEIFYNKIKEKYPDIDIKFIGGNQKSLRQYVSMAFRFATSSSILIDSYYRHLYNVKHRGKTKFIQIWHATGIFKRFGLLAIGKDQSNSKEFEINAHHYYTHVIVSGDNIVKPYAEAFGLSENKVLPLGVSRTDEFFDEQKKINVKNMLYNLYPMLKDKKVILYAPTFRGDDNERKIFRNQLEFNKLKRLKDEGYILLCKMHPAVQEPIIIPSAVKDFVYDFSHYPNINDLFFITDILITDYSSSIFEFSLLRKPIILFAYDLPKYLNERGFYYDYEDFVPGPICKRTEEIVDCINNINQITFNYDKFVESYMNRCDGHSTDRLIELVMNDVRK